MPVAILGRRDDCQVAAVSDRLASAGVDTRLWDAEDWPGATPLSVTQEAGGTTVTFGEPVDPDAIDAVYYRPLGLDPRTGSLGDAFEERPHAVYNQIREYRGLALSGLRTLEDAGVPVVNPVSTARLHTLKPYQLATFAEAGVPVPETLTTNDPAAARAFVERVDEAIYKPVGGGGHARAVDEETMTDERVGRLQNSPVQFQERLTGETLRLFVLDGDVVATVRVVSEALDYRAGDHDVERYDPHPAVADAAVTAAETLDLRFSGVDVIVEDDGFGVLEANPSPMFAGFDELAGTDVAGALAEYLASYT